MRLNPSAYTTTGQYGGIGALIGVVNNRTVVTHPYRNFPAFKSGIKVGDEIVSVNGKIITGKNTSDVSLSAEGTTEDRSGIKSETRLVRKNHSYSISAGRKSASPILLIMVWLKSEVGYMRLDDFTPGAAREVA